MTPETKHSFTETSIVDRTPPSPRGETLAARTAHGPTPWPELVAIGDQLLEDLEHAHRSGIVRGDLEPAHIAIDRGPAGELRVTIPGGARRAVSPLYRSPEQLRGKLDVGPEADLWAVGAILHEMSTGRIAFLAGSVAATQYRICHGTADPIRRHRADAPDGFVALVTDMLERDPARRLQDATAARTRLRASLAAPPTAPTLVAPTLAAPPAVAPPTIAPPPGFTPPPPPIVARPHARAWRAGAIAGAAIVLGAVIGIASHLGSSSRAHPASPAIVHGADDVERGVFVVRGMVGLGTGFFVDYNGERFGVTAFHVVAADGRVVIETQREERRATGKVRYQMPIYADVAYVDPARDLAVLRFDRNVPIADLGASLPLATREQLAAVPHEATAHGINDTGQGTTSILHPSPQGLTSELTRVAIVDAFTERPVSQQNPWGFTIDPGVKQGFSGGPVVAMFTGAPAVIGVSVSRIVRGAVETSSIIVASSEVQTVLEAAAALPRPEDLSDPNAAAAGFDLKANCSDALRNIARMVQASPETLDATAQMIAAARAYPSIAPASRRFLVDQDLRAHETVLAMYRSIIDALVADAVTNNGWISRDTLASEIGAAMGRFSDMDTRIHGIYYARLRALWGGTVPSLDALATVVLDQGREQTAQRGWKQVQLFTYNVRVGSRAIGDLDFEYAQGHCGVFLPDAQVDTRIDR